MEKNNVDSGGNSLVRGLVVYILHWITVGISGDYGGLDI